MKELKLSNTERRALVDDCEYERCRRYIWHKAKTDYSISILTNYDDGTSISLARFILGDFEADVIDHKDRNPFNNKWKNLREATFVEQLYNTGVHKNNFSGSRGIELRRGMYRARIKIDGKDITIGSYRTLERAIQARLEYIEK